MEEEVKISLVTYEKMRDKERGFDELVKEMELLKVTTKKEVDQAYIDMIRLAACASRATKEEMNDIMFNVLNTSAKEAGFTVKFKDQMSEGQLGDGSGRIYELKR